MSRDLKKLFPPIDGRKKGRNGHKPSRRTFEVFNNGDPTWKADQKIDTKIKSKL